MSLELTSSWTTSVHPSTHRLAAHGPLTHVSFGPSAAINPSGGHCHSAVPSRLKPLQGTKVHRGEAAVFLLGTRRPKDVLRGPVRGLLVNLGRHMDVQIGSRRYRRVPKPLLDDL
jgi:hypothetical protein